MLVRVKIKRQTKTAHLLTAVHRQTGTGNSKLEQENNKKNDHVLGARGQRNNELKHGKRQTHKFKPL